MFIGYNVSKINQLMGEVLVAHREVCLNIRAEYNALSVIFRKEWIGPDEVDFEETLIARLNNLIDSTTALAQNTIQTTYDLGCAWITFQTNNTISNKPSNHADGMMGGLKKPGEFKLADVNIEPGAAPDFSSAVNLGLANEGSPLKMEEALATFVTNVKRYANELFSVIDTSTAFMGVQETKISQLMTCVGDAIGVVGTAIKDFKDAMYTLTHGSYGASDQSVGDELVAASNSVNTSLNNLENGTKWS